MRNAKGFTLIELVVVLVILGVLAAVAVPRFIDLSDEAETAAVQAQASALSSAFAINFAGHQAGAAEAEDITDTEDGCDVDTANKVVSSFNDDKFSIVSGGDGDATFTLLYTDGTEPETCSVDLSS